MPLDTCIDNVGEYYSAHYLDTTFAKDIKELASAWQNLGSDAPSRRLAAQGDFETLRFRVVHDRNCGRIGRHGNRIHAAWVERCSRIRKLGRIQS